MSEQDEAMREAIEATPGSIRALAAEAGVSDTLLRLVAAGDRTLTPEVAARVAAALRRYAERTGSAAKRLERVADRSEEEER